LRIKTVYFLSKLLEKLVEEQEKESKTTDLKISDTNLKEKLAEKNLPLVVLSDKSVYVHGSDMIVTIINPNLSSIEPMNLKIFNENKKLVYKNSIPINQKGNGIYQEVIAVDGEGWERKPGSEYLLVAEHEGQIAKLTFFLTDFGATIELDQKVYSWTDKVYITVIAPDLVRDFNKIETIGNIPDCKIAISTRKNTLTNYELVENGKGTGIFTGEVKLTGFKHDAKGDGKIDDNMEKTEGNGPNNGLIASGNEDGITVTLVTPQKTVTGGALIRWNYGEIKWIKESYRVGDTGEIVVIDPDMNLNSELIDMFKIRVWSDSDPKGIEVILIETGNETGIFSGAIQFGLTSNQSQIKVSPGDSVVAEYVDRTLPEPNSVGDKVNIISTTTIQ